MSTRLIPEIVVEGKRLGRHVNHDERSLAYALPEADTIVSVQWPRVIPVLDQGDVGSCTGNACTGILGTQPDDGDLADLIAAGLVLNESEALKLYSAAETIDGDGPYPPNDNGSSGLSVAKAAQAAGLCSGYLHALSVAAAHTAIQSGPFMVGSDWYTSFDTPDSSGLVAIASGATVRGGHEYECIGYDLPSDLWHLVNSWGTEYGVAGHFYYSTETFASLLASEGDVTSLVPLSKPAPVPSAPSAALLAEKNLIAVTEMNGEPVRSWDAKHRNFPPTTVYVTPPRTPSNAPAKESFLEEVLDKVRDEFKGLEESTTFEAAEKRVKELEQGLHKAMGLALSRESEQLILQVLQQIVKAYIKI